MNLLGPLNVEQYSKKQVSFSTDEDIVGCLNFMNSIGSIRFLLVLLFYFYCSSLLSLLSFGVH